MSMDAETDAIHENSYEELNDSPKTEEGKKFATAAKRNQIHKKISQEARKFFRKNKLERMWGPNWSRQHKCPVKRRNAQTVGD